MCYVVNLKTHDFNVYIGRPGRGRPGYFGNPFIVGVHGERGECVELFRRWFYSEEGAAMRALVDAKIERHDVLGCFCKPAACHGDVIAEYVNSRK